MADRTLNVRITGDASNLGRSMKKAEADAAGFQGSMKRLDDAVGKANRNFTAFRNVVSLVKFPAMITGAGLAAQALNQLGAGAVAATSALAPLSGAIALLPAGLSAAAQGMGTVKLATAGVGGALGGLNDKLDESSKKFKSLSPEAQRFVRHLDAMKPRVRALQQDVQRGLFPGLEEGLKRVDPLLRRIEQRLPATAKAIGGVAARAGEALGQPQVVGDISAQMTRNNQAMSVGGNVAVRLTKALVDVVSQTGKLQQFVRNAANAFSLWIMRATHAGRETGKLAHFFDETRIAMSRVARIAGDVAGALFNVAKQGKPLGDELLVSLTKNADKFREWTESAKGRNAIADWFEQAREPLYEMSKLVLDVGKTLGRLGRDSDLGPLIKQIRTEMLPAIENMVSGTTKAFAPALVDALTNFVRLFSQLAGTSGPLTGFVRLLGGIAGALADVLEKNSGMRTLVGTMIGFAGVVKAIKLVGMVSGFTGLAKALPGVIKGIKAARGAMIGLNAAFLLNPFVLVGAALVALGAGLVIAYRKSETFRKIVNGAFRAIKNAAIDTADKFLGFVSTWLDGLGAIFNVASKIPGIGGKFKGAAKGIDNASDSIDKLRQKMRNSKVGDEATKTAAEVRKAHTRMRAENEKTGDSWTRLKRRTRANMDDIQDNVQKNTSRIKRSMDRDSSSGREALAENFRKAQEAVRRQMRRGVISTQDGMSQIRKYLEQELQSYGLSIRQAKNIAKGGGHGRQFGDPDANRGREGGSGLQRGGGIGGHGDGDKIPALLEPGEYVVNKKAVAHLGEDALDEINFKAVPRFKRGGRVSSGNRMGAAVRAANQLESRHFAYHRGGGHQGSPAPFGPMDCSGAVSYVLQHAGIDIPTMVSGQMQNIGKPGPGAITLWANPEHVFMSIGGRYFGTSGSNPGGGAGWMPDPGAGYKSRFTVRHFGAAGDVGDLGAMGGGSIDVPAPKVRGGGLVGAAVNQALKLAAAGASKLGTDAAGSMGIGTGDPGDPGPGGSVGKARLKSLWIQAGGPRNLANTAAAIAMSESSGIPSNTNPSGATGLWQILGAVVPGNLKNPLVNARNAVKKWRDAGGFSPWVDYVNGRYRRFMQRGGKVRGFQAGGGTRELLGMPKGLSPAGRKKYRAEQRRRARYRKAKRYHDKLYFPGDYGYDRIDDQYPIRTQVGGLARFQKGGAVGALDRIFPGHHLSDAEGHTQLNEKIVRGIAESVGFNPTQAMQMAQIAHGESNYYPGIISSDGGYGLLQMTPRTWGPEGVKRMNELGGLSAMRNPIKNLMMAKFLFGEGGFAPWHGTKFLNRKQKKVKSVGKVQGVGKPGALTEQTKDPSGMPGFQPTKGSSAWFEEQSGRLDLQTAKAEETPGIADDRKVLKRQLRLQKMRLKQITAALKKGNRKGGKGMTLETRVRLRSEAAQLRRDIRETQNALSELGVTDTDTTLDIADMEAGLTPDLGDDLAAAKRREDVTFRRYQRAKKTGNKGKILEAGQAYGAAVQARQQVEQSMQEGTLSGVGKLDDLLSWVDLQARAGDLTSEQAYAQKQLFRNQTLAGAFGAISEQERLQIRGDLREEEIQATQDLVQALEAHRAALKELTDSVTLSRQQAAAIQSTDSYQLKKVLADTVSGHLFAYGIAGRSFTPGTGVEAAY